MERNFFKYMSIFFISMICISSMSADQMNADQLGNALTELATKLNNLTAQLGGKSVQPELPPQEPKKEEKKEPKKEEKKEPKKEEKKEPKKEAVNLQALMVRINEFNKKDIIAKIIKLYDILIKAGIGEEAGVEILPLARKARITRSIDEMATQLFNYYLDLKKFVDDLKIMAKTRLASELQMPRKFNKCAQENGETIRNQLFALTSNGKSAKQITNYFADKKVVIKAGDPERQQQFEELKILIKKKPTDKLNMQDLVGAIREIAEEADKLIFHEAEKVVKVSQALMFITFSNERIKNLNKILTEFLGERKVLQFTIEQKKLRYLDTSSEWQVKDAVEQDRATAIKEGKLANFDFSKLIGSYAALLDFRENLRLLNETSWQERIQGNLGEKFVGWVKDNNRETFISQLKKTKDTITRYKKDRSEIFQEIMLENLPEKLQFDTLNSFLEALRLLCDEVIEEFEKSIKLFT